ncbi:unnamed protein product [Rhizoctonia solani]|uniref:MYND-type domain-containing protein n=1 Tax=Rhizoctonia solani TaxID=456999 RepID=A0A8H3BQH6_9AGAM|nr:unnamed protein product [Rhizoctonia solani]
MAHPLCWPSARMNTFSPLGKEAATSLTQDLSPEQSADILLLECRNPQHVLYTLSTDVTCPPTPRKIDLTCCDPEAAALARDIILFTLLEDDVSPNHIWEIIYHLKLTEHALGLLISHSRKLSELAASPETWRQSKYGSFIKMVDAASLSALRHIWTQYAEFPELPFYRHEKLQKELDKMSGRILAKAKGGVNPHLSQSAAGMWQDAVQPVNDQFSHYWVHGTTATANKEIKKATRLNPTFCYSAHGEAFNIDEIVFPVGYHFAPASTPLVFDPAGPATNSAMTKAKQQFKAGCLAFQASRKASSIVFRYFAGDAIMLCCALALYKKTNNPQTGEFKSHWQATPIDLTEHVISSPSAPDSFDVIECSTLSIRVGLFNLLLVGQPLLKKNPASQSVLYTEMLLHRELSIQIFWRRLWGSVPTIGLLLGLAPRSYLSLFSSMSNVHMHTKAEEFPLFTERIPWVNPVSGDKYASSDPSASICFEADDLARLLCDIYLEMIHYDTVSSSRARYLSPGDLQTTSDPHFTRETFAIFVAHVKNRIRLVDKTWSGVMDELNGLIAYDGTENSLLNHFCDLQHQLRLHGVLPLEETGEFQGKIRSTRLFSEWERAPRLVCVVLTVPSTKLDPLRKRWSLEPSPRLVCEYGVDYEELDLTHSSIHAAWGKCVPLDGSDGKYVIEEDPEGFRGKSDLVVSFWTDAEMLLPPGMKVWLSVRKTPHAIANFSILGPKLQLFEARLLDRNHVLLLRERPMGLSQTQKVHRQILSPPISAPGEEYQVKAEFKDPKDLVRLIIARVEMDSDVERQQLSQAKKAAVSQIGPCSLELTFGTSKRVLRFPYPISQTNIKVKIKKSTHCVDVTALISKPIDTGGYPSDPFPIVQHTTFSPWNIHHVHIDRMPKVDIKQKEKIKWWLINHTALQLSDRERLIQRVTHASNRRASEALVNFKESMTGIVLDYVGVRAPSQGRHSTFVLIEPTYGIHTIIMVSGLRLDLAGMTFVLDCAIVSAESAPNITPAIQLLEDSGDLLEVRTRPIEVPLWKRLLPAFVERGRTWPHKADCRYNSEGTIPLSDKVHGDPLCQCGHGIGLDGPDWNVPAWKALLPHATRAVLSPLFGVSYLEVVGGPTSRTQDQQMPISWGQPPDVCWECGGIGRPLLLCAKCNKARYCSQHCQELNSKEHKRVCK